MCQHLQKNFCEMKDEAEDYKPRRDSLGSSSLNGVLLVLVFRAIRLLLHIFIVNIEGFLDLALKGCIVINTRAMLAIVISSGKYFNLQSEQLAVVHLE